MVPSYARRLLVGLIPLTMVAIAVAARHPRRLEADIARPVVEWGAYGRDPGGMRDAPIGDIAPDNVGSLTVAWTYHTGERGPEWKTAREKVSFEATPIMVDGTLYLSTPLGRVIALDPETGTERWRFDPHVDRSVRYGDFANRGVSTWLDSSAAANARCRRRIIVAPVDARLIELDATTGTLCDDFGVHGSVNLRDGLRNAPFEQAEYEVTSPPAVVNGVIVTGSGVADNNRIDAASGEVRAFDARTGRRLWSWDPVPQDSSDPAWRSWQGPKAHHTGAANAWSVIAADPQRDLVFVPTGSASVDYFGGERLGSNHYANSVVALHAHSGTIAWHFQVVHHDLWDYDIASPPALITVRSGGREIAAVAQTTKSGMLFVLDRDSGQPIFPVEERAVPASTIPGEHASKTQPFTTVVPPLSPNGKLTPADLWGLTPTDLADCQRRLSHFRSEGIFTPPSLEGTLVMPSNIGGAHWGGMAFDSARGLAVVNTNRIAALVTLIPRAHFSHSMMDSSRAEFTSMRGTPYVMRREMFLSPSRLPCTKPPFGELQAIDLTTGARRWAVPLGTLSDLVGPKVAGSLPAGDGSPNLGGPIVTSSGLVFVASTTDFYLRAFDIETGRELWKGRLPAGGKATPMTYRSREGGRQYVVIAAGGDADVFGSSDALVAFALPEKQ